MNTLRISLIQSAIAWENKTWNLEHYGALLQGVRGKTDLAVLPETFSTGFSMDCNHLAESNDGNCMQAVKQWAVNYQFAICGSFLAKNTDGTIFNRGFFITPEGESFFYDKKHLFRMGNEDKQFTAGNRQVIIPYKGWNICMIICYDLRFPVWCRNVNKAYDLLICPANWPQARDKVWQILLQARALENYSYVCGVNRIGEDGHQIKHKGNSMLIDFKGNVIAECKPDEEEVITSTIYKESLEEFRTKFPVWKDADAFTIV